MAERAFAFRKRLEAARNAGVAVDYPLTALAVCDVTLKYRRRDLEKPALLKEYALLPKIRRQFRQLDAILEQAEQDEKAGRTVFDRPVSAPLYTGDDTGKVNGIAGGDPIVDLMK